MEKITFRKNLNCLPGFTTDAAFHLFKVLQFVPGVTENIIYIRKHLTNKNC